MKNFNKERGGRFSGGFGNRRDTPMHKAVCSNCSKTCEVPFKPVNGKPVYCKECFEKMGGGSSDERNDRPRREFSRGDKSDRFVKRELRFGPPRDDRAPRIETRVERPQDNNSDLKQQLQLVNTKLDKLISMAETFFKVKSPQEAPIENKSVESTESVSNEPLKKVIKKAVGKKASKK